MTDKELENIEFLRSVEAEEAILGGILLDPTAFNRVKSELKAAMFSLRKHQIIYKAAVDLDKAGQKIDLMSISDFLVQKNLLDTVGGMTKLSQLVNRTVSAINIDRYTKLVIGKWKRRELISLAHNLIDLAQDRQVELSELTESFRVLTESWLEENGLSEDSNLAGKIAYTATARQSKEHFEEVISLEAEIDLSADPKAQIKKLQAQAQRLFQE